MFRNFFYDLGVVILAVLWLPKIIMGRLSGKYRQSLTQRLGLNLKRLQLSRSERRVWIHAVSVGETKAAAALAAEFKRREPSLSIVISTTTETGQEEARRSIPYADAYFFLPLDFSFVMRRLLRILQPSQLLLVEGEFWWNLIYEAKRAGVQVSLVNGKISERSFALFRRFPFFSRSLFSSFDCCCLQTDTFEKFFLDLGVAHEKITITGNLKFDFQLRRMMPEELAFWRQELCLHSEDIVVVLASTHEKEEELLLEVLRPFLKSYSQLKVLVVPRHPSRFDDVAKVLQRRGIEWLRYSEREKKKSDARLILIDTMGELMSCFQLASLAIVAGSFVPGIGGHNLFEPASVGLPVIFGPYVDQQRAYADALLAAKGGVSVPVEQLHAVLSKLLACSVERHAMGKRALEVVQEARGAVSRTVDALGDISKN